MFIFTGLPIRKIFCDVKIYVTRLQVSLYLFEKFVIFLKKVLVIVFFMETLMPIVRLLC
jgi:hypothetical protein